MNDDKNPRAFLSYARADRTRVAKIAEALTAAGLSVWWDTAIEGGSAFAKDIARELDAADVVIVVWSEKSVESAWVLDEAGAGRDRKRLVPVQLDGTLPPLGFRQLQAIDLSAWKGRASDPKIAALVAAVRRVAGSAPAAAPAAAARAPVGRLLPWLAALLLVAGLAAGWHYLGGKLGKQSQPVVAVLPFTDMSGAKGQAYFAEGLAEEILDTLARDTRLKVLGGTTARAIRDNSANPDFARDKLGVTRLLEGSVRGGGGADSVKVSVRLIDTADGSEIWTQAFERSGTDVAAVQEEVAQAVAIQLAGPLGSNAKTPVVKSGKVPTAAYEKVLVARQLLRARQTDSISRARTLASEAIALAPDYAPAYAVRSQAITLGIIYIGTPLSERRAARQDAETAIKLDPSSSDGYAALGRAELYTGNYAAAVAALNRSLALKPDTSEPRFMLGTAYRSMGNYRRAIPELESFIAGDPLWPVGVWNLTQAYAEAGRADKAREVARIFRSITPNQADADGVDAQTATITGDYARSLKLAAAALARNPQLAAIRRTRVASLLSMQAAERLEPADSASYSLPLIKLLTGQPAAAADLILQGGPEAWQDQIQLSWLSFAFMALDRPADLVRGFDAHYPSLEAYLAVADELTALNLAAAFDRVGRTSDARKLRNFARAQMLRIEANGTSPSLNAQNWAFLLLSEGDRAGALTKLEKGVDQAWWQTCGSAPWIGEVWSLAPLHGDPRFEAVKARCRMEINKQRKLAGMQPAVLR